MEGGKIMKVKCEHCGYRATDAAGKPFCEYHGEYLEDIPDEYRKTCPEYVKE
jgi:rubredoxin